MGLQSWSPQNLYNLWRRSCTPFQEEAVFTQSSKTLFQQRWIAKRLTRAYHGDFINEKIFKRWYLRQLSRRPTTKTRRRYLLVEMDWTGQKSFQGDSKQRGRREACFAPVASLMFEEVERRIDVFIFRCCFAHSVYEARRLVIHGRVLVNGKKVRVDYLFNVDLLTLQNTAPKREHQACSWRYRVCRPQIYSFPPGSSITTCKGEQI